jgi:ankyrin repeat protein
LEIGEADAGYQTRNLVLSEAESSTDWCQAIERKDCKTLMTLLRQEGSAFLLQTGKAGRTALHVAAIQGSLELVHTIGLSISKDNLRDCLTQAIDDRCKMKAEEIASDIIGYSREWKKTIFEDLMNGKRAFTPDLIFSAKWRSKYELTRDDTERIEQMITIVRNERTPDGCYEGLIDSFQKNVDYNFGTDEIYGNLFLFHHACSRADGREFVKDVIKHCRERGEVGLEKLMRLRDFQGRTPLHVAVAVAPAKDRDDVLWTLCCYLLKNGDWSQYLGVGDGRGWTLLHLAATQPYSHVFRNLFVYGNKLMRTHGADAIKTEEDCTALHLAVFHNNTDVVRVTRDLVRDPAEWRYMISRRIKYKKSDYEGWSVLALAMLLGNQDILDILMSGNEVRILSLL